MMIVLAALQVHPQNMVHYILLQCTMIKKKELIDSSWNENESDTESSEAERGNRQKSGRQSISMEYNPSQSTAVFDAIEKEGVMMDSVKNDYEADIEDSETERANFKKC